MAFTFNSHKGASSEPGAVKPHAPSGIELMLRNMGLSEVLDIAKRFASDGTVEKIIKFADDVEHLIERSKRQEALIEQLLETFAASAGSVRAIAEPDAGSAHASAGSVPARVRNRAPAKPRTVDGPAGAVDAGGVDHRDGGVSVAATGGASSEAGEQ